jgi:2-keto-4-pentenoate hydratase
VSLADTLLAARLANRQVATPVEPPADPYAVQDEVTRRLGWEPLGWKIAATTPAMQARLRMDEPIRGRSFRRFATTAPAEFIHAELLDPLVEAEFFVTLAADIPQHMPLADIIARIARIEAGVEIAECRFPMAALPAPDAIIADGCANGRYVFGPAIPPGTDVAAMPVTVTVDGKPRRTGHGHDVMGHPLHPLAWLARQVPLRAGETISTGTATGMLPVRAGETIEARFGDLPPIRIAFLRNPPMPPH